MKRLLIPLFALFVFTAYRSVDTFNTSAGGRLWKVSCDTSRKPFVAVSDTMLHPMIILVIRDTAASATEIGKLLGKNYSELYGFISQNRLTPGAPMSFYYTSQPPFIMETAVEVDKMPGQTKGRIRINKLTGGDAVVAHYIGPYSGVAMAYEALYARIKVYRKMPVGVPFEVYLNSPMQVKDSFDLRTDIFQPVKQIEQ